MSQDSGSSDAVCDRSSSGSRGGLYNSIFLQRIKACMNSEEEVKRSILSTDENLPRQGQIKNPMNGERDTSSTIGKPQKRSLDSSSTLSTATATATSADTLSSEPSEDNFDAKDGDNYSFFLFRMSYLIVTFVIMLSDGLQGTHLYVLYEGYGFSVASLYCLGFITGAVTAPITGPMVDKLGRKKAALLYCFLEVGINMLEQFPFLSGLIVSRVVGGVTTNLLSTVFEAWVDTEYRKRRFDEDKYENLMRDSVVVSNLAAIASGYLAHVLAERLGPVGPFEGAVTCTAIAFAVVLVLWTENYGSPTKTEDDTSLLGGGKLRETIALIRSDSRVLRVCITQGFTMASLHIFIFLWSPVLKEFAAGAERGTVGLDDDGEPAYGLIFGAFMTAGVVGGLCSPSVRKMITLLLSPMAKSTVPATVTVNGEELRPMDVEFQGAFCYFLCAGLLLVPCLSNTADPFSYKTALIAFVMYELLVGIYSPCEGVIRSLYMPSESRGSMMTIPRFIVNVAVALGVVATEVVSHQTALGVVSLLMAISGVLQLSLVSKREWRSLITRVDNARRRSLEPIHKLRRSISGSAREEDAQFGEDLAEKRESSSALKHKSE